MNTHTHTAPGFLSRVPDSLLQRRQSQRDDDGRAKALLQWFERRGVRPNLLEVQQEHDRRGYARRLTVAESDELRAQIRKRGARR
jgi:hypothetical protein